MSHTKIRTWATFERSYIHCPFYGNDGFFSKESIISDEEFRRISHLPHHPTPHTRLENERKAMKYIRANFKIPIAQFEGPDDLDDEPPAFPHRIVTQYVDGIRLSEVELQEDRKEVQRELAGYAAEVAEDTREGVQSFSAQLSLPPDWYHTEYAIKHNCSFQGINDVHPLCHGDMTTLNVLVDKDKPKIAAIIDWEYAGFYPQSFQPPVGSETGGRREQGKIKGDFE